MSTQPPNRAPEPTPFGSGAPSAQRGSSAAADELRKAVRSSLNPVLGDFLKQLPAQLLLSAPKTAQVEEQKAREELARSVSNDAKRWLETFVQKVDARLIGDVAAGKASQGDRHEDGIGSARMELKAESLHQKAVAEFDARLDRVRQTIYLPVYGRALAPAGMFRALQETAEALEVGDIARRILFARFDDLVVPRLGNLYRTLTEAVKQIGNRAEQGDFADSVPAAPAAGLVVMPGAAPQPGTPAALTPKLPAPAARVSVPRSVDGDTINMLRAYAKTAGPGLNYNDGSLAQDLLALQDNKSLKGMDQDQRWVPLQRMTLAGMFLNEAIADPFVSPDMRPQHESVRFPLVKSALTDSTLFTSVTHPLRSLVNDLMLKSATSRITGNVEERRMAELLQQVLVQFDLAPDFVRQAMVNSQPIDEAQIQRFFEMQRTQAQQRRDAVINEAKRLVVREIELLTFGRDVPQPTVGFLNSAWGPMLIKRLLQHGAGHESWKDGVLMMERLLDALEARESDKPPPPEWQELSTALVNALATAGLPVERQNEARSALAASWTAAAVV